MQDAHTPPPPEAQESGFAPGATLFDLVATCLERMEREGPAALQALCREHPAHADRLRKRIAQLGAFGLAGEVQGDGVPERLGQFRLLSRLGGGGMGVVYAAEQEGLQRRVALKLVRPGTVYFPGARERFRREVDVLARLTHPGIVPVYAGGEEQGVPYLAMELVHGATLEEALAELPAVAAGREPARLLGRDLLAAVQAVVARRGAASPGVAAAHASATSPSPATLANPAASQSPSPSPSASNSLSPSPTPSGRRSAAHASGATAVPALFAGNWVSTCTRLAQLVAEALAYAHQQGVLHRDIKPSNIMLTAEGRVLLLDFGLASAEGSVRLTGSGQPLGSPAYMSPEQVRGEREGVDARADVWSLGVTLYEALTLRQPFASDSVALTSRLVLAAHPPAPRSLNAAIPADLETVVLAALERDAARRYAGPAEFARDLRNVLELRPITVRPPSAARRLLRWTQRRPALATACVLGALLLVAGPLGWELQRRESLAEVLAAGERSERHFHAALSAIGHVLRDVATEELEDVPRMQRARLVAIDRALALFPELERDRPGDVAVLTEGAELHLARGDILRDLGRAAEALPEYDLGVALSRRLAALHPCHECPSETSRDAAGEDPTAAPTVAPAGAASPMNRGAHADPERTARLALVLDRAAKVRFAVGRADEAEPLFDESLALLRADCAAAAGSTQRRSALALTRANLSESLRAMERFDEARAELDEALLLAVALRAESPGTARFAWVEGRIAGDIGGLLAEAAQDEAAEAWARRSLQAFTAAHDAEPERRYYAYDVATGHAALTRSLLGQSRLAEAEAEARTGLDIVEGLLRDYPDVVRYREQRHRLLEQLGICAGRSGRVEEAVALFETRVAELDEACRLAPERGDLAYESAQALNNLVAARSEVHADADAILALVARGEQRLDEALAGGFPPSSVQYARTMLRYARARTLCFADRIEEACAAAEEFSVAAEGDAFRLRYAADLWNELRLALRRVGDGTGPVESAARERMHALLGEAVDAGYAELDELASTPSLDPFRDEPEFVALLARLAPAADELPPTHMLLASQALLAAEPPPAAGALLIAEAQVAAHAPPAAQAAAPDAPPVAQAASADRVITAVAHHLGDNEQPEWTEAAATPEGVSLTLEFEARDTGAEQTLCITQRNVHARWALRINDTEVAELRRFDGRREVAYRVPAGVLRDGVNTLDLRTPETGGNSDDVTLGPIRLVERPLVEVYGLRSVRLSVHEEGSGLPMPARITLTDAAGVPVPRDLVVHPPGVAELAQRDGLLYIGEAALELALPSHAIEVWVSRGSEWSLGRATIPAAEDQPSGGAATSPLSGAPAPDAGAPVASAPRPAPTPEIAVALRREVDTTGFVAADTHLHTLTFSGHGDASVDERLWTLAGEGVEFAVATDHNHVTDYRPRQRELQLGAHFTAVPGSEVTTDNGHFNAFPLDPAQPPPEHRVADWVALVEGIRAAGAQTVVLNHPRWPEADRSPFAIFGLDARTGARASGGPFTFDAMELVNSTDAHPDPMALFTDWFALLNRGERIAAVGTSDSHTVGDPVGQGRTWVPSATDVPADIDVSAACRAIAEGRTSFGQGIFTRLRVEDRYTMGDTARVEGGRVRAVLTVRAPGWVAPRSARLFLNGVEVARTDIAPTPGAPTDEELPFVVPLPGHDAWLVAVVTGDAVEGPFWPAVNRYTLGATNPVFLDADGDGECTRPRALAAARLARLRATDGKLPGAERAALLRGDAALLLHLLDQLAPGEDSLRAEVIAAAAAAGGAAHEWVTALIAQRASAPAR